MNKKGGFVNGLARAVSLLAAVAIVVVIVLYPRLVAEDSASGRALEVFITQPGIQLYTGNWLDDEPVKDGGAYGPRAGFAVEPEYYPNGMHHADWPQPICTPEHPYEETIVYRFGTTETLGAQEAHVEG